MAATAHTLIPARPRRILNHDVMSCTAEGVPGNHLYSGRALGLSVPGDVIQLHPDLAPEWPFILRHYQRAGIEPTREVIWDVAPGALSRFPGHEPSVFFFGAAEHLARSDAAWHRAVDFINSKNNFMHVAEELGITVPRTLRFADVAAISADAVSSLPYPCYLKAAVSVSGVGIYRCADADEMIQALDRFSPGVPVQVQAEVRSDVFLNLQYEVTDHGVVRVAATEQVLDGFVHQGNRYPARYRPWFSVQPMADWLYAQGMKGIFAFDVAVVRHPDGAEFLAIECNPRFNGASYPTAVAQRLGIESWLSLAFSTRHRSLADIDLSGLEYDPARGYGVIIVNWGPILVGKLLCLLAGTPERQQQLHAELLQRLA